FLSLMVRPPTVCGWMERTPSPARRPSAGAVLGRRGARLAVRVPPAALLPSQVIERSKPKASRLLLLWIRGRPRVLRVGFQLLAPLRRLVRLGPGVVEPNQALQGFLQEDGSPLRRNLLRSLFHPLVAFEEQRLGFRVLPLA